MNKKSEFLYRIVKWEHLIDLFENSYLFFARPSVWDDPYELRIEHPAMSEVFAQCWSKRGVSDAMWRIYSPEHFGVRIKIRRTILADQLKKAKSLVPFKSRKIGAVKYLPQSIIDKEHKKLVNELSEKYDPIKALNSLMYKRNAFKHEEEIRVLLYATDVPALQNGIKVPVSPHELIETILADPRMPEPVYKAFSYYINKKICFPGRFGKSSIYSAKNPLRVGYDDDEIP
jgi:Protein of unknown function (DUF2971)